MNKPSTNQNVITKKAINVYTDAYNGGEVFGRLEENLRYPLIGKMQDRQNNAWYETTLASGKPTSADRKTARSTMAS